MKYFLLIVSLAFGSSNAWSSDHDGTPSQLAVIWECTLNDGITARDVAEWGSTDFKKFTEKNSLNMTSYLWEAISVNPPFDAPDVRWVDYYPSWSDFYEADAAWLSSGRLAEDYFNLVTCEKPITARTLQAGAPVPEEKIKTLYARVCQLNEGATIQDAVAYREAVNKIQNSQIKEGSVGSFLFSPGFGLSGFDYVAAVAGSVEDMALVLDGSLDGSTAAAIESAGHSEPAQCVVDLHRSHTMVN